MKTRLFLKYILFISITLILINCAKKGRDQAISFLNNKLKNWITQEDKLVDKYNKIIIKKDFRAQLIIDLLKKELISKLAKLRQAAGEYKTKFKPVNALNKAYIEKLDYLVKGLTKIRYGLEKSNQELLNQGRSELANYQEQREKFNKRLQKFLRDYHIKIDKGEK